MRAWYGPFLTVLLLAATVGCGRIGYEPAPPEDGAGSPDGGETNTLDAGRVACPPERCACPSNTTCELACPPGCDPACLPNSRCTVSCPDDCELTCSPGAECRLRCAAGCQSSCSSATGCSLACEGARCGSGA